MAQYDRLERLHLARHNKSGYVVHDLYEAAKKNLPGKKIRLLNGPKEPDFEANFFILKHPICPAVLTEGVFMDTRSDVEFLLSREGKNALMLLHVEGILEYLCRTIRYSAG